MVFVEVNNFTVLSSDMYRAFTEGNVLVAVFVAYDKIHKGVSINTSNFERTKDCNQNKEW